MIKLLEYVAITVSVYDNDEVKLHRQRLDPATRRLTSEILMQLSADQEPPLTSDEFLLLAAAESVGRRLYGPEDVV